MPNDIFANDNQTTIDTSETVSSITLSEEKNTIETTADKTEINVIQQVNDISITQAETTEINLEEYVTTVIAGTPEITGSFTGDISVPYLSSFKSETTLNGITQGFSLGLTDSTTTTLQCFGDTYVLGDTHTLALNSHNINLDGHNISIDAVGRLDLVGDRTDIFCQLASFKLGNEKSQNGLDLGARFASAGSPFTGIFAIENTSTPNTAESRCPFIILEGKIDNATYPNGSTQEFMHIGIDNTGGTSYSQRNPILVNPRGIGFGIRLAYSSSSVFSGLHPVDKNGNLSDARHSLGNAYARWYAVYAATSQIITSDRTHKQDIEELSEAEERVAVACKGLLRKFKLRQSVEEKGDNARIHFGIIAQDLQQAFIDEGLDPAKYAMFCSDTWYELDGEIYTDRNEAPSEAKEVTQLGVRYEQLLAFIIASL